MAEPQNYLLLLNTSPSIWRAMEEFHYRLAKALVDRGATVVIVLAKEVPPDILARYQSSGATVHYLAYRDRWKFFFGLRRLIRQYRITTVHIRFFRLNQLVPWAVKLAGAKRIVYTDAESNEATARGLRRALKRLHIRLATAPNTRLIAISEFVKGRMVESGVPAGKITVVHNGVDLTRFTPDPTAKDQLREKFNIASDELILTTISRLVDVKHVDVILNACAILKSRGVKFRLLIVSPGGPLEGELKNLCRSLNLDNQVIWHGATPKPEEILQGTDIFILASCGEAFGNVLVEAMACGVPVVASRSGAAPEIIVDAETGFLAEPRDPESFAKGIEALVTDSEFRRLQSHTASEKAHSFTVERAVKHTSDVYEALS